ncbi:hypothetical protein C4D60_Mb08t27210 [Musa balbisiana]|uniref:Single-stranded DNA binding protein Ssb-like OB fold domain-containing protein n=1 Tax=Musa balbisiana TaxID=52838 RepID=A0A4S8K6U1_MUSBA|nr:hypothetical protein C4D60_Mb08t27210 [Musa balbisiana]
MLTTKAVSSKIGLHKEHPSRHQVLCMLLAEILVGDETGVIVFTARNDQDTAVILENAKINMAEGSMRLAINK